ncbi:PD40 domain-containing protein [Candidatus Dojkabacteria bacterium]|nr:PD40 domain-containing protein [Candidatus Dojkabacteria bacterium]
MFTRSKFLRIVSIFVALMMLTQIIGIQAPRSGVRAAELSQAGGTYIRRVSVSSEGVEGNGYSGCSSISGNKRFIAFNSGASNLVTNDTNRTTDVFVHDITTGETKLVSVSSSGEQGNDKSTLPSISDDGRYITFQSDATNLVLGDSNEKTDIFLHDMQTGETKLVSVSSSGEQGNSESRIPSISGDGKFVAFESYATNFDPEHGNSSLDIFVHDMTTGETKIVSVSSEGVKGDGYSGFTSISEDGRFIAFESIASNLVTNDTNESTDVFVHDMTTGETKIVSVSSSGEQGNYHTYGLEEISISNNGRYIVFPSGATNLIPNDFNDRGDIFIHDQVTGETKLASVSSTGEQGNEYSRLPSVSEDGRFVTFSSRSTNLVPGNTYSIEKVFVHDMITGETKLVSVSSSGELGNDYSHSPSISNDGRYVAFPSEASNLVIGDFNQTHDIFVVDTTITPQPPKTPLIFIPGTMGSKLVDQNDGNKELWLGLFRNHNKLSLYPDDDPSNGIVPTDILRTVATNDIYTSLINKLTTSGYVEYSGDTDPSKRTSAGCDLTQAPNNPSLFIFPYDWRKDIDSTTAQLYNYMQCIQQFYPGTKVDILAHSMGSVVARRYILNYPYTNNVDTLLTVGAPWLGSPQSVYVMETGKTGLPIMQSSTVKRIAGSFPGLHDLIPGEAYYQLGGGPVLVENGWDINNNGKDNEKYSYPQFRNFLNMRYGRNYFYPGTTSYNFHSTSGQDDWRGDISGVNYIHFLGIKKGASTIGSMKAEKFVICLGGTSLCHTWNVMEVSNVQGDGTVPLLSLSRIGNGYNINAPGTSLCAFTSSNDKTVDHGGMLTDQYMLDRIVSSLESGSGCGESMIRATDTERSSVMEVGSTITMTTIADSKYVAILGGTNPIISDSLGNSTAPISTSIGLVGEVPEVTTYNLGEGADLVIYPMTGTFTATWSTSDILSALDIQVGDGVTSTYVSRYMDLNLPVSTSLLLYSTPYTDILHYDANGDGTFESIITPTIVLSGSSGVDITPPTVGISVTEGIVTISAVDLESGVKDTKYSLDGTTFLSYTDPFTVDLTITPVIYAFSEDNMLNRSGVVEYREREFIYLPLVLRSTTS